MIFKSKDIFLDQKRVNIFEHMVKMAPHESFGKVPPEGLQDRKGEEWRGWREN